MEEGVMTLKEALIRVLSYYGEDEDDPDIIEAWNRIRDRINMRGRKGYVKRPNV